MAWEPAQPGRGDGPVLSSSVGSHEGTACHERTDERSPLNLGVFRRSDGVLDKHTNASCAEGSSVVGLGPVG